MEKITAFIHAARVYFDASATKEMLKLWKNLLCPYDTSMTTACERFNLFLPTLLYDEEEENLGFKLWLEEFLNLWFTLNARNSWETVNSIFY